MRGEINLLYCGGFLRPFRVSLCSQPKISHNRNAESLWLDLNKFEIWQFKHHPCFIYSTSSHICVFVFIRLMSRVYEKPLPLYIRANQVSFSSSSFSSPNIDSHQLIMLASWSTTMYDVLHWTPSSCQEFVYLTTKNINKNSTDLLPFLSYLCLYACVCKYAASRFFNRSY